ncbi:MAG: helix-turn-helix domain-containing protein [Clostridiales bacterium]|nr:helix-turn-helix domain-containing protein [Clostridiales bacterium]
MTHIITEEEYRQCVEIERKTQDKKISKKLRVIILRYEGKSIKEIGEYVKLTSNRVSHIIADFKNQGIDKILREKIRRESQKS